jgi:hypothetical protein
MVANRHEDGSVELLPCDSKQSCLECVLDPATSCCWGATARTKKCPSVRGPPGASKRPLRFPQQIGFARRFCMGTQGRLAPKNGGFRPGQSCLDEAYAEDSGCTCGRCMAEHPAGYATAAAAPGLPGATPRMAFCGRAFEGFRCAVCRDGYIKVNGECERCDAFDWPGLLSVLGVILLVGLAMLHKVRYVTMCDM